MALERSFKTQLPAPAVWAWISDLDQLTDAMPGFTPAGRDGSDLTGKFVLRVGSQQVTYTGQVAVTTSDRSTGRLELTAAGAGARGSGEASAVLQFRVQDDSDGSMVTVIVEPAGEGRIETFDPEALRASGERLLDRFVAAIEERLPATESASTAEPEPVAVEPEPAPAVRNIGREPTERLATVTSISDVIRDRSRARRSAAASAVAMVAAMIALWLVHRRNAH